MSFNDDFEVGDGFQGVQEAPLPDSQPAPKRRVVQPTQRESSIPDPNKVVQRPKMYLMLTIMIMVVELKWEEHRQ